MAKKRIYDMSMDSIHLEGSLFVPDMLEKVVKGNARYQGSVDYRIPKGLKLNDEYGRAFQIALAQWRDFKESWEREDIDPLQVTSEFVLELFNDALGWKTIKKTRPVLLGEMGYPVQFLGPERTPVTITDHRKTIDESDELFSIKNSGYRKRTPFQMVQEYLNSTETQGWAVVTNGKLVRLLRSSATLARPQYLEFDLQSILDEMRYAEFAAFWRIIHGSRILLGEGPDSLCVWEQWRNDGIDEGLRVRDGLREGVTKALILLGSGFIEHPANDQLRESLRSGKVTKEEYFQQLLRLIYRFLFLFAMEERKSEQNLRLLHLQDDTQEMTEARNLYDEGYSLIRLREKTLRWVSYDTHDDIWKSVLVVFGGLANGEPLLALPALGGLFDADQCVEIDNSSLSNKILLHAMYNLRWTAIGTTISFVDYKNMGSEELGSVYESLLELVPIIDLPARKFSFIGIENEKGSTAGNIRKTTGSYYTPDSLVQQLIKTALIPVIEQKIKDNPKNPVEALLSMSVIDPACGSGHFLLAAGRKIAEYLAQKRSVDGIVLPSQYRHALRDVISHCLYGVDLNPMAVELTRMALWLEGFEPGKPLSFLNHHILCGNSLVGIFDLEAVYKGIPNEAFKALTGDDKAVCTELKKENAKVQKQLRGLTINLGQHVLFGEDIFVDQIQHIESLEEQNLQDVKAKEKAWEEALEVINSDPKTIAADLIIAAFLSPKTPTSIKEVPTNNTLFRVLTGYPLAVEDTRIIANAKNLCKENNIFHWPLYFPKVFEEGGFDVVLGNPPWERIKLQEKEFFASRRPEIAQAPNAAKRRKLINNLLHGLPEDLALYKEFTSAVRLAEAQSVFAHLGENTGGRFPLSGIGDVNLYALFAEVMFRVKSLIGRAGFIVPTGVATDDSTKVLFSTLVTQQQLVALYDFENREGIFPSVHRSYKFCLLTLGQKDQADFTFFLTNVDQLPDQRRHFQLTAEEFTLINPNTMTCPIFRSKMDAELTKKIYRNIPILINETKDDKKERNPWGITFQRMLDMSNDSALFKTISEEGCLPLYEAKMMHQFDHRWATYTEHGDTRDVTIEEKQDPHYEVRPRYWVDKKQVLAKLADVPGNIIKAWLTEDEGQLRKELQNRQNDQEVQALALADDVVSKMNTIMDKRSPKWLMGWRNITNATNERTLIASIIPRSGVGNNLPLMNFIEKNNPDEYACLIACLSSIIVDFVARQKVGGINLNFFFYKQFPVITPSMFSRNDIEFIAERVLELTYTSKSMKGWAKSLGYGGEPFSFIPERRAILRAELDARFARLYGLNKEELMYILDPSSVMGEDYPSETFRGLKNNEMREFGEYKTMRLVLEAWDRDNP